MKTILEKINKRLAEAIQPKPQSIRSDEPPIENGMLRVYHGGIDPTSGGSRKFISDRKYAEGKAKTAGAGSAVYYVDVPLDHPAVVDYGGAFDPDTGMRNTVFTSFPEDVVANAKPLPNKLVEWPEKLEKGRFTEYCKREGFEGPCKACAEKALKSDDASVRGMASFYLNTVKP